MAVPEIPGRVLEFGRAPATVMFTDMVGYSELTQRDESGALRLLNEHRRIVRPLLAEHGGREVKTIGDAFMVEFSDSLSAVRCALAIQSRHAERNRDPSVAEVTIRIGLHAGEVIHQEGDLFGDTVNIASRIEPLSPPGGICLSAPVYDAAQADLDVLAIPVGPATLKNIHLPVPIYRIDPRPERYLPIREGPWVDREEELVQLGAALSSVVAGSGRVVLVDGDMGVGKTRLAEQIIRLATRREARVAWGRASEEGASVPYTLWVQAIEALATEFPREAVVEAAGEYSAELQRLVPSLGLSAASKDGGTEPDPDRARDRLFAGVAHFFGELARQHPIVLLLDDLQWADPGSAHLLRSLARSVPEGPLLLLVLHRPVSADASSVPTETLSALELLPGSLRISLRSLTIDSVRQLVLALLKTKAIPDEFVRQIFGATGGNPYFLEEVIRSLRELGILSKEPGAPLPRLPETLPLPDSVRRLVRQRLERLDEPLTAFLRTASVLGYEFPLEPLSRLTGLAAEPLTERLGQAVALGLLTELSGEQGSVRYAFPDRLVRETLYADSPVARRVRDHLRAGEALDGLRNAGHRVPAAEVAYHFQRAQATDRALTYTLLAAEEATRVFAREEAVRQYREALSLLEVRPEEKVRARVLEALGGQLYRLGQIEAAYSSQRDAIACFERLGDLRAAGNLHRKIAHSMRDDPVWARHHWEEAQRLLEGGPETAELAHLYVTIAGYRYEEGDTQGARELYGRAVGVARTVQDPSTQVSAEIVLAGLRPAHEAAALFRDLGEAIEVAERERLDDYLPTLYMVLAIARLHVQGDAPGSQQALDAALERARRARDTYSLRAVEGNFSTYLAWRLGDYERALRTVEAHLQYAAGDPRKLSATAILVDADIALARGESDRLARDLEEAGALLEGGGDWSERVHLRNERGRAELRRDRPTRALEILHEAGELAVRAGAPALMAALYAETLHLEIEAALRAGNLERAGEELRALEGLGRDSDQPTVRAYTARARALLLGRSGDLSGELGALEEATTLWEKIGWAYELARTRLLLAGAYRRSGAPERGAPLEDLARGYLNRVGSKDLAG